MSELRNIKIYYSKSGTESVASIAAAISGTLKIVSVFFAPGPLIDNLNLHHPSQQIFHHLQQ